MALSLQSPWRMSSSLRGWAERASGRLFLCGLLTGCASTHVAQSHPAHAAQPVAHGAGGSHGGFSVHSGANAAQGVASLIYLGAELFELFSSSSSACPDASEDAVVEAVAVQGRVWTLHASGTVCSFADGENTPRIEDLPEVTLALCPWNGTVAALTDNGETTDAWTLRQVDGGVWRRQMTFDNDTERFVALDCAFERVTLLSSKRVLVAEGGETRDVRLSAEIPPGFATLQVFADQAYLRLYNGELGGEFLHVNVADGQVAVEGGAPEEGGTPPEAWSQPFLPY